MNVPVMIISVLSFVCAWLPPTLAKATELSTAANGLSPGRWARLSNPPFRFFLQGSQRPTLSHLNEGTWDPITRRAYFVGAGREGYSKLHVYDDAGSQWKEGGRIPEYPKNWGHGYNHNALDAGSGILAYIRPTPSLHRLYQLRIRSSISTSNAWELISSTPNDGDIAEALAYFPERGTWIVADGTFGKVLEFDPDTNTWSTLATKPSCFDRGGTYHNFAAYLPHRGEVALGGGNTTNSRSRRWCTLDSAGGLTQRPDAPVDLHIPQHRGPGAVISPDPASGDLLALAQNAKFYAFDFLTNRWGQLNDSGRPGIFNRSENNVIGTTMVPISTYGVMMFAKTTGENAEIWIYKHSSSGSTPVPPPSPPPSPPPPPAPPSPPPAPPTGSISVNFQPGFSDVPAGYLKDTGSPYTTTRGYGWTANLPSRDRNSSQPQRLDTFVFARPGQTATWEYTLPNGVYRVSLATGDPSYPQGPHIIAIEGDTVLDGVSTQSGEFVSLSQHATTITDGALSITIGGSSWHTMLNYVVIEPQ